MKNTLWPRNRMISFLVPPFYKVLWYLKAHLKLKSLHSAEDIKWFEQPLCFFYVAAWISGNREAVSQHKMMAFHFGSLTVAHFSCTDYSGLWRPVWIRRREVFLCGGVVLEARLRPGMCVCVRVCLGKSVKLACTLTPYGGLGQWLRKQGLESDHEVSSLCSLWPWASHPALIFLICKIRHITHEIKWGNPREVPSMVPGT